MPTKTVLDLKNNAPGNLPGAKKKTAHAAATTWTAMHTNYQDDQIKAPVCPFIIA